MSSTATLLQRFALLAFFALPLAADTPAPGFSQASLPYPGSSLLRTLNTGELVVFDGVTLAVHDAAGAYTRTLTTLPSFVFGSFMAIDPSGTFLVLGESSNGDLFRVDLASGARTLLTNLTFNYDGVFEDADHIFVSAATTIAGNDVHRVDTTTGATTLLVQVFGPSGPLVVDAAGDLVLGVIPPGFPTPPGATELLVFDAAGLTGSPVLMETDARLLAGGFDGASDLIMDAVNGELFLAVNDFGTGTNRIRRIASSAANSPIVVDGTIGLTMGGLELDAPASPAVFRAFQPASGSELRYTQTDFFSTFVRRSIAPARPQAFLSGPGAVGVGSFDLNVSDGPPNSAGLVFFGASSSWSANELAVVLPQANAPLLFGLSPVGLMFDTVLMPVDANGVGLKSYNNPSGTTGFVAAQVLFLNGNARWVGTSATAFL